MIERSEAKFAKRVPRSSADRPADYGRREDDRSLGELKTGSREKRRTGADSSTDAAVHI